MKYVYLLFCLGLFSSFEASAQLYWEENGATSNNNQLVSIEAADAANIPTNYSDWFVTSGNVAQQVIITNRNNNPLSQLAVDGYPNSGTGNVFYTSPWNGTEWKYNNIEYNRRFGNPSGAQEIYMSMIMSVHRVDKVGPSFHVGFSQVAEVNNPDINSRTWGGRLLVNGVSGSADAATFELGLTKNGTDQAYSSTTYNTGDILIVVMKITMDGDAGNGNDQLELYVTTPENFDPLTQPTSWHASITAGSDVAINAAFLRERMELNDVDNFVDFGHIRVANSWGSLYTEPTAVSSVSVTAEGDATSVAMGSVLQMNAEVLPVDASDRIVSWSVAPGTGSASINTQGLLQPLSEGTVTITATSRSNPDISGSTSITILPPPPGDNLVWTGDASDGDIFNEANWVVEGTTTNPVAGSIDDGVPITDYLIIENENFIFSASTNLLFAEGYSFTVRGSNIAIGGVDASYIVVDEESTLTFRGETPMGTTTNLRLEDNLSWVKMTNVNPNYVMSTHVPYMSSAGSSLVKNENLYVNQYYYNGVLLRLKDDTYAPLTLFDGSGQSGSTMEVGSFDVYSSTELGDFNNKASSFKLARGFMATVAIYADGTGKSEVYIASEDELLVDLPTSLDNTISFVRVMPWNWVTKKGASQFKEVGSTWTYNWNRNQASTNTIEYAPMAWGGGGARTATIPQYLQMQNVTHVMSFNEADNCDDQSGQYVQDDGNKLCVVSTAVALHENLMGTGLRIVSPSPRENASIQRGGNDWLLEFRDLALQQDIRYDVVGVHWYDWDSNPTGPALNDTPSQIFNRFKAYIEEVYAEHGLPVWITEFNANANRDVAIQRGFLELAMPWLEAQDYVERYDFFEPSRTVSTQGDAITYARYFVEDEQGNPTSEFTDFGIFYRDFVSGPSIPGNSLAGTSMLSDLETKIGLSASIGNASLIEGAMTTVTFTTDRATGAPETFELQLSLDESQATVSTAIVTVPEGQNSAQVTLSALTDQIEEDVTAGTITITNLSTGLEYSGGAIAFNIFDPGPLSVESGDAVALYPNPTQGSFRLLIKEPLDRIVVTSLAGQQVMELAGNRENYDISSLEDGIYVLKLMLKNGKIKHSLISKQ